MFILGKKSIFSSIVLGSIMLSSHVEAQNFPSNGISNFTPSTSSSRFQIDSGVTCPTPSLDIVGFGGSGGGYGRVSDHVTEDIFRQSGYSGRDNYGVSVGVNIPFGGQLGDYCAEYTRRRLDNVNQILQTNQARYQADLIQNCMRLAKLEVNFDSSYFSEGQPGEALSACRGVIKAIGGPKPVSRSSDPQVPTEVPLGEVNQPSSISPRPTLPVSNVKSGSMSAPLPINERPILTEPIR